MKLRDLFLPKLAHSDPNVRKKAVLKEHDPGMLKKVVENDKSREVRGAAILRLRELGAKID
jgi:hypothetical protein